MKSAGLWRFGVEERLINEHTLRLRRAVEKYVQLRQTGETKATARRIVCERFRMKDSTLRSLICRAGI